MPVNWYLYLLLQWTQGNCASGGPPPSVTLTRAAILEGNQEGGDCGVRLSGGGVMNGDGLSDFVVGATEFDAGIVNQGAVFAFLGAADGLSLSRVWSQYGEQASEQYGWDVALAGDVNGDGFSDLLVGVPGYETSVF